MDKDERVKRENHEKKIPLFFEDHNVRMDVRLDVRIKHFNLTWRKPCIHAAFRGLC